MSVLTIPNLPDNQLPEFLEKRANKNVEVVHITKRPTVNIISMILSYMPNVKVITCPPSLYERTPKRIIDALKRLDIELKPEKKLSGRPTKYNRKTIENILRMHRNGVPVKEISKNLGIPPSTIYYHLSKFNNTKNRY